MCTGMFEIKQHSLLLAHFDSKNRPTRTNIPSKADPELSGETQYFNKYSTLGVPKLDKHQVDLGYGWWICQVSQKQILR